MAEMQHVIFLFFYFFLMKVLWILFVVIAAIPVVSGNNILWIRSKLRECNAHINEPLPLVAAESLIRNLKWIDEAENALLEFYTCILVRRKFVHSIFSVVKVIDNHPNSTLFVQNFEEAYYKYASMWHWFNETEIDDEPSVRISLSFPRFYLKLNDIDAVLQSLENIKKHFVDIQILDRLELILLRDDLSYPNFKKIVNGLMNSKHGVPAFVIERVLDIAFDLHAEKGDIEGRHERLEDIYERIDDMETRKSIAEDLNRDYIFNEEYEPYDLNTEEVAMLYNHVVNASCFPNHINFTNLLEWCLTSTGMPSVQTHLSKEQYKIEKGVFAKALMSSVLVSHPTRFDHLNYTFHYEFLYNYCRGNNYTDFSEDFIILSNFARPSRAKKGLQKMNLSFLSVTFAHFTLKGIVMEFLFSSVAFASEERFKILDEFIKVLMEDDYFNYELTERGVLAPVTERKNSSDHTDDKQKERTDEFMVCILSWAFAVFVSFGIIVRYEYVNYYTEVYMRTVKDAKRVRSQMDIENICSSRLNSL
jgi:hypothetical protein